MSNHQCGEQFFRNIALASAQPSDTIEIICPFSESRSMGLIVMLLVIAGVLALLAFTIVVGRGEKL
jgi:hypothetical protein